MPAALLYRGANAHPGMSGRGKDTAHAVWHPVARFRRLAPGRKTDIETDKSQHLGLLMCRCFQDRPGQRPARQKTLAKSGDEHDSLSMAQALTPSEARSLALLRR